ncbi:MAG: hypothetical protein LUG55_02840, partial [Clostridiales bacterium]|nr:hypothetical protein [Clostridiales bacterium]
GSFGSGSADVEDVGVFAARFNYANAQDDGTIWLQTGTRTYQTPEDDNGLSGNLADMSWSVTEEESWAYSFGADGSVTVTDTASGDILAYYYETDDQCILIYYYTSTDRDDFIEEDIYEFIYCKDGLLEEQNCTGTTTRTKEQEGVSGSYISEYADKYAYTYNEDGTLQTESYTSASIWTSYSGWSQEDSYSYDDVQEETTYTYDSDGTLLNISSVTTTTETDYDDDGVPSESVSENVTETTYTYTYFSDGTVETKTIAETYTDDDGYSCTNTNAYTYDSNGKVTEYRFSYTSSDGYEDETVGEYTYTSDGETTQYVCYERDSDSGELVLEETTTYDFCEMNGLQVHYNKTWYEKGCFEAMFITAYDDYENFPVSVRSNTSRSSDDEGNTQGYVNRCTYIAYAFAEYKLVDGVYTPTGKTSGSLDIQYNLLDVSIN